MELKDRIINIIEHFEKIREENPKCGDLFCGTCGGYGSVIRESLSTEMYNEISDVLDNATSMDKEDINTILEWSELFSTLFGYSKIEILDRRNYYQIGKSVDLTDIRAVDSYLFYNRRLFRYMRSNPDDLEDPVKLYKSILKMGIALAIETHNSSLAESIFIVLDKEVLHFPDFIEVGLEVCPDRIINSYLKMIPEEMREEEKRRSITKKMEKEKLEIEQKNLIIEANYRACKMLKDSGLFNKDVLSRVSFINRGMVNVLAGKVPRARHEKDILEYLQDRGVNDWSDL